MLLQNAVATSLQNTLNLLHTVAAIAKYIKIFKILGNLNETVEIIHKRQKKLKELKKTIEKNRIKEFKLSRKQDRHTVSIQQVIVIEDHRIQC